MGSISAIINSAALSVSATESVNVGFSTTVGGKTYSADVTYSDGAYVATAPGVAVGGSSVEAAESNLTTSIDELA